MGGKAPWRQAYVVDIHWVYCVRIYSQVSGREGTMVTGLCGGHTLGVLCKNLFPSEWEGRHHGDRLMGWTYIGCTV